MLFELSFLSVSVSLNLDLSIDFLSLFFNVFIHLSHLFDQFGVSFNFLVAWLLGRAVAADHFFEALRFNWLQEASYAHVLSEHVLFLTVGIPVVPTGQRQQEADLILRRHCHIREQWLNLLFTLHFQNFGNFPPIDSYNLFTLLFLDFSL